MGSGSEVGGSGKPVTEYNGKLVTVFGVFKGLYGLAYMVESDEIGRTGFEEKNLEP